jgi:zinc and cadmium transporter
MCLAVPGKIVEIRASEAGATGSVGVVDFQGTRMEVGLAFVPEARHGDWVLVHAGFARTRAFGYNVAVGVATLMGALAGYVALADKQQALPTALAIAASSLLYVAVADLIPGLHRRVDFRAGLEQVLFIALGVGLVYFTHQGMH